AGVGHLHQLERVRVRAARGRGAGRRRGVRRHVREDAVRRLDREDRPPGAQGRPQPGGGGFRVDPGRPAHGRGTMIALLVLTSLLAQQDPTYAELSKKHGLGAADQRLREGKFLEAAVAYRNVLMSPGDREAVRIPLAIALLAKGDAVYAGIEIRRAHLLYPDFARVAIDAAELFGSKGALSKI